MSLTLRDDQLRRHIVEPVLHQLDMYSEAAVRLVLGTALVESNLDYIHQLGRGPARGLWQMEPATHDDIRGNYLAYRTVVKARVDSFLLPALSAIDQLTGNLFYGCAMARIHYRRVPAPLPDADDIAALGRYWKDYYNTHLGAGSPEKFIAAWRRFEPEN